MLRGRGGKPRRGRPYSPLFTLIALLLLSRKFLSFRHWLNSTLSQQPPSLVPRPGTWQLQTWFRSPSISIDDGILPQLLSLLFLLASLQLEQALSAGDDSTESLRPAMIFGQVHSTLSVPPRLALIATPPLLLFFFASNPNALRSASGSPTIQHCQEWWVPQRKEGVADNC